MKKIFLMLCVMIITPLYVFGQGYTIVGEVSGSAEGQTVTLRQFRDLQPVDVATTTIREGKFTFSGITPYPEFCMLFVDEQGPVQFFVENAQINILLDVENLGQSKVSGSRENDILMEFVGGLERFAFLQQQLNDSYISLSTSSVATPEAILNVRSQLENLNSERTNFMVNFVLTNSGQISSAFIVATTLMQALSLAQMDQLVNGFDATTRQSQWVKMISDHVLSNRRTEVGQKFADITLDTPEGSQISISDYAGKGKYVVLDFWAAWCGPCRNANPQLVQLYHRYKDRGFEIVGISLDQSRDAWIKAIEDDQLAWPQMSDLNFWQSAAAKLYSVNAIPHMVLLDQDGTIIAKGLSIGGLASKLAEIFD